MAMTKSQEQDLDRWIQNGRSWTDETQPSLDDDYEYLDEDCYGKADDDERFIDMYDD